MPNLTEWKNQAIKIIRHWKGEKYIFGFGVLEEVGRLTRPLGNRALLVVADLDQSWMTPFKKRVEESLNQTGITYETILGASPNTPVSDVYRIALHLSRSGADVALALGGGSTIDAVKASTIQVIAIALLYIFPQIGLWVPSLVYK